MTPKPAELPAPMPRVARRRRQGVVLLFVVVLLTLLAVIGSAFLISTRVTASQLGAEARGQEVDTFGRDAKQRVQEVRAASVRAAQLALILDVFERNGALPANAGNVPTAERDYTTGVGGGMLWRPDRAAADDNAVLVDPVGTFAAVGNLADNFDYTNSDTPAPSNEAGLVRFPYFHVDALGLSDPHLSARLPTVEDGGTPDVSDDAVMWEWIGGPLAGVPGFQIDNRFVDPLRIDGSILANAEGDANGAGSPGTDLDFDVAASALLRANLEPTIVARGGSPTIQYPTPDDVSAYTGQNFDFYNDRVRSWPGLKVPGSANPGFLAADADGDGVADSGLMPIVFDDTRDYTDPLRYRDTDTNYYYLVGIRIVDNNAGVNVNTAQHRSGDFALAGTAATSPFSVPALILGPDGNEDDPNRNADSQPDMADTLATGTPWNGASPTSFEGGYDPTLGTATPNFGIFRSNLGFFEMFPQWVDGDSSPNAANDGFGNNTRDEAFHRLLSGLIGNNNDAAAITRTTPTADLPAALQPQIQFGTSGEVREFAVATQLQPDPYVLSPAFNGDTADPISFTPSLYREKASRDALLYRGGGLLTGGDLSRLERSAEDFLVKPAGNYVRDDELIWGHMALKPAPVSDYGTELAARRGLWAAMFGTAEPADVGPDGTFGTADDLGGIFAYNPQTDLGIAGSQNTDYFLPISPRAGLVTHNGVSQVIRPKTLDNSGNILSTTAVPAGMPSYDPTVADARPPVRASANASRFDELYRAFWSVIAEPPLAGGSGAYGVPMDTTGTVPQAPFLAGNMDFFTAAIASDQQAALVRAAIAAVNTMDIRDVDSYTRPGGGAPGVVNRGDTDVTVAQIELPDYSNGVAGSPTPRPTARVFGMEAHPLIDEVVLEYSFDPASGARTLEYVAVELINPYPWEMDITEWRLAFVDRNSGGTITFATNVVLDSPIPAADPAAGTFGHLLVTGGTPTTPGAPNGATQNTATITPGDVDPGVQAGAAPETPTANDIILVRPIRNDMAKTSPPSTAAEFDDMVPVDGVVLKGFAPTNADPADPAITLERKQYRYARPTGDDDGGTAIEGTAVTEWDYVYAGPHTPGAGAEGQDNESLIYVGDPLGGTIEPGGNGEFGVSNANTTYPNTATPVRFEIGPTLSGRVQAPGATQPTWPYGGFARDGDILAVPFVGSYVLRNTAGDMVELGYPSIDLDRIDAETALADAQANTTPEGFGRFIGAQSGYEWAGDVLDYLTAMHSPGLPIFPLADPRYFDDPADATEAGDPTLEASGTGNNAPLLTATPEVLDLRPATGGTGRLFPYDPEIPVASGAGMPANAAVPTAGQYTQAFNPVEGLINLNTATSGVMQLLPLAVDGTGAIDTAGGVAGRANSVVGRRDYTGAGDPETTPLASLFNLDLTGFTGATAATRVEQGDLTGLDAALATDLATSLDEANYYDAPADYEEPLADVTRISNLASLRSDSYTVYIVIQAWENVGNPTARLVRQERVAFTVDRSGILPFDVDPSTNTPTQWNSGSVPFDSAAQQRALEALKVEPVPVR